MTEGVVSHLAPLAEALEDASARWAAALRGARPSAVVDDDVDGMSDADLMALNEALSAIGRRYQLLHSRIANGISKRSAPERGEDGLARKAGFRSPEKLIAASTGGHAADAKKLIQVGEATEGRMTFSGERAPARHPHIAAALEHDRIGRDAAAAIICLLDKLACRVDRDRLDEAERVLAEQAGGLSLSDVQVILRQAEAWLDPDGLEPKIENLRNAQYLKIWQDRNGMINLDGKFAPADGAPVKTVIEALVTAQIRAMRGSNQPNADRSGASQWAWSGEAPAAEGDAGLRGGAGDGAEGGAGGSQGIPGPDDLSRHVEQRTIVQLNADALVAACKHVLGCDETALPLATTTVVVRIPLEAITTGTGVATIDGITQPIDAGTARRMAADAEIIPIVLGEKGEVLDCGRRRRLFTRAQRLSLWERDGGCSRCGAPPEMCEAHHLTWWSRGGTTDLDNGILLCTSCHHSIHKDDWDIRIDGADVWFIPPAHIDPDRTPRLGGRRRYHYRLAG